VINREQSRGCGRQQGRLPPHQGGRNFGFCMPNSRGQIHCCHWGSGAKDSVGRLCESSAADPCATGSSYWERAKPRALRAPSGHRKWWGRALCLDQRSGVDRVRLQRLGIRRRWNPGAIERAAGGGSSHRSGPRQGGRCKVGLTANPWPCGAPTARALGRLRCAPTGVCCHSLPRPINSRRSRSAVLCPKTYR